MTDQFHTLGVIGGFAGGSPRSAIGDPPDVGRFLEIDRDEFDSVLARIAPEVELDIPWCRCFCPTQWEDFHPDALLERLPGLSILVEARSLVHDPAAMQRCLEEAGVGASVSSRATTLDGAKETQGVPDSSLASMSDGELLDSILGSDEAGPVGAHSSVGPARDALDQLVRDIVAESSGGPVDHASQDRFRQAIEAELSKRLRAVLWHPGFRALESCWGSLRALVRSCHTNGRFRIVVASCSQSMLQQEAQAKVKPEESAIYRLLAGDGIVGGRARPCDAVVSDFQFDAGADCQRQIAHLAKIAGRLEVPVLAAAGGSAIAVQDASELELGAWNQLQSSSGAAWIGLCAPKLMLRQPYGRSAEAIETFDFEEGARVELAQSYAWASAAFALGQVLARALSEAGDLGAAGRFVDLEGLPIHVDRRDGEASVRGPVSQDLTEPLLEAWSLMGLIPVTGIQGTDRARVLGLRSLARSPLLR